MSDKIKLLRDPEAAERVRVMYNENEARLLERLRAEMADNPKLFLESAFGTAYNYVPYPDFDHVGALAGLEVKARTRVALEGLAGLLRTHPGLNEGKAVLLVSESESLLLSEALSNLRKQKEEALAVVTAEPKFRNAGFDAKAFGIPTIAELIRKVNDAGELVSTTDAGLSASAAAEASPQAVARFPVEAFASTTKPLQQHLPGGTTVEGPGRVKQIWNIQAGISDRFGDIDADYGGSTPVGAELMAKPGELAALKAQMWGDTTFISWKDGRYGVLYETEVPVAGDQILVDAKDLPSRDSVMALHRTLMSVLAKDFPQVDFCLVPDNQKVWGRPGIWAFVPDGALYGDQRATLGERLLSQDTLVSGMQVEYVHEGQVVNGVWAIETNLTDRWGSPNDAPDYRWRKPGLAILERDPGLLADLQSKMHGDSELTFIARMDGDFGILVEMEFPTSESEDDATIDLRNEADVIDDLRKHILQLSAEFPQVQFAIPDSAAAGIANDRPALWGYVRADKHTPELMDTLCDRLQEIAYGRVAENTVSAAP